MRKIMFSAVIVFLMILGSCDDSTIAKYNITVKNENTTNDFYVYISASQGQPSNSPYRINKKLGETVNSQTFYEYIYGLYYIHIGTSDSYADYKRFGPVLINGNCELIITNDDPYKVKRIGTEDIFEPNS